MCNKCAIFKGAHTPNIFKTEGAGEFNVTISPKGVRSFEFNYCPACGQKLAEIKEEEDNV